MSKILIAVVGAAFGLGALTACAAPANFKNGLVVSNSLEVNGAGATIKLNGADVLTSADPIGPGSVGTNELDAETRGLLESPNTNSPQWVSHYAISTGAAAQAAAALLASANATNKAEEAKAEADDAYNLSEHAIETADAASNTAVTASGVAQAAMPKSGGTFTGVITVDNPGEGTILLYPPTQEGLGIPYLQGTYFYEHSPGVWSTGIRVGGNIVALRSDRGLFLAQSGSVYGVTWTSFNHGPGSGLNADKLDGYTATDFLLTSTIPGILRQVFITPPAPTSPGTNGTWMVTNNFFYLCVTNGFGVGTNWNRVQMSGWTP